MTLPRRTLTVTRYSAGETVKGRWIEGSTSTLDIKASVQPINAFDMASLPEGRRKEGAVRLFTDTELFGVEPLIQENPDRIEISGVDYEVFRVMEWNNLGTLDHYEVIATVLHDQS